MTKHEIIDRLDKLAYLQQDKADLQARHAAARDKLLRPLAAKLAQLDRSYATASLDDKIEKLTAEVKKQVEAAGESVKGEYLHAVFSGPRVSWNNDFLEGMAVTYPGLLDGRKLGKPSVSIRPVAANGNGGDRAKD